MKSPDEMGLEELENLREWVEAKIANKKELADKTPVWQLYDDDYAIECSDDWTVVIDKAIERLYKYRASEPTSIYIDIVRDYRGLPL